MGYVQHLSCNEREQLRKSSPPSKHGKTGRQMQVKVRLSAHNSSSAGAGYQGRSNWDFSFFVDSFPFDMSSR